MSRKPSRAVMEARAPASVERDDAVTALYRALDYFPTPPWAARAGAELVQRLDPLAKTVWEPACGEGHMAGPLAEYFSVFASDIHPHGFGLVEDFLQPSLERRAWSADWVITNPPFKDLSGFVSRGLEVARSGVAMLLRTAAVESGGRAKSGEERRRATREVSRSGPKSPRRGDGRGADRGGRGAVRSTSGEKYRDRLHSTRLSKSPPNVTGTRQCTP